MVGIVKFSECVVMRRPLNSHIVDADFFVRLQIVIYDHAPCANDGHFTNFSRLEPTALDSGEALVREIEGHIGYVLHVPVDMCVSLTVNRKGELAENMENDRNVMGRQVPGDIDVCLEQTEVQTP